MQSKEALERELKEARAQIDTLEKRLALKPDYGMGKGDPLVTRWELNQALLKSLKERAASVQAALARFDEGTYGVCERCGRPIHPDRMAALPEARLCIRCARGDSQETGPSMPTRRSSAP